MNDLEGHPATVAGMSADARRVHSGKQRSRAKRSLAMAPLAAVLIVGCGLYALFAAIRLARFNTTEVSSGQRHYTGSLSGHIYRSDFVGFT